MNIRILHTNDVHSRFEVFAKAVSKIKELKNENTIILDAGDFNDFMSIELQGTKGKAGCSLLNISGYDAIAVGNNEGFQGIEVLETMASTRLVPLLSCNLYKDDMSPIKGIKRSIIIDKLGIKFLVVGVTPMYNEFFSIMNMYATDPVYEIKKELETNKEQYDFAILLSHLGIDKDLEIAEKENNIDIIIGGHSHTLMDSVKVENETIIHQSGGYSEYVGILDIEIKDRKIMGVTGDNIKVGDMPSEPRIMSEILRQKELAIEILSKPLYRVDRHIWHDVIEENPITNLLADALLDILPCDLSVINSGIINGGIREGDVSKKKLLEICPSPLNPTYMEIEGKYIKEALKLSLQAEVCLQNGRGSGFRGRYLGRLHVSGAIIEHNGKDILSIKLKDGELEDKKVYKVATSDYLQRGTGYPSLANNKNETYNPEYIRDVLREYLNKKGFLDGCFKDRWIKIYQGDGSDDIK